MTDRETAIALLDDVTPGRLSDDDRIAVLVAALRAARAEGFAIAQDNASAVEGCGEGCCGPSIDWDDAARLLAEAQNPLKGAPCT